jgi:hypothetical protein
MQPAEKGGIVSFKKMFGILMLTFLLAVPGMAKNEGDGIMIGITVPYITFAGYFDGVHFYNTGAEILLVPKVEGAFGYGLTAGSRKGSLEWDLYYMHSSHNFTFEDIKDTAVFDAVGANTRFVVGSSGVIRPYVNMGMDFCWLKANNASLTVNTPIRSGSVKFSGLGIFGGLGIGISPVRAVTLYIGGELRWGLFGRAKGVLNESHKLDKLNSLSFIMRSGLVFVI